MAGTHGAKYELIKKVLALGHLSVLEHVSFTFGVEGISRACSHQLVRSRIASFSQQSQRYVKANNFGYDDDYTNQCVYPPSITTEQAKFKYRHALKVCHQEYAALIAEGISAEDARFVLPNAEMTKIIVTMNARELHHFFSLRCCNRAQWEIRAMAKQMLILCKEVTPLLFENAGPGCLRGKCPEGEMGCGKLAEVRKEYLC
jgi:thymidylate synthase (FAD)